MHLYRDAAEGRAVVGEFPITEYGEGEGVALGETAGTVDDALTSLRVGGLDHGCALNSFELPGYPFPPQGGWPPIPPYAEYAAELRAVDEWICAVGGAHPEVLPFVTVNPAVLGATEAAEHVARMADEHGARGVKLHTIALRAFPAEPSLATTFAVCAERRLPVVAHCGPDRHGAGWALPAAFAPVLERHPDLPLVLAHLGGAAWRDAIEVATAFPSVRFDLSEIVSWTGIAPGAPDRDELGGLIRGIGAERVLLGSDFPWYEPGDVIAAVEELPGLGEPERAAILGENAAALLGMD
ncbi:MAG: amidohydrolase family protein [Actinobacteria bacterium]|nr:amidohydrolase family protein [Actinomycetota bacterium]